MPVDSRKDLFLRSSLPVFHFWIYLSSWTKNSAPFYWVFLLPHMFPCSACSFSLCIFISLNSSNHSRVYSRLCFEISSTRGISPKLSTWASGSFFFFAKAKNIHTLHHNITKCSLGNMLKFVLSTEQLCRRGEPPSAVLSWFRVQEKSLLFIMARDLTLVALLPYCGWHHPSLPVLVSLWWASWPTATWGGNGLFRLTFLGKVHHWGKSR